MKHLYENEGIVVDDRYNGVEKKLAYGHTVVVSVIKFGIILALLISSTSVMEIRIFAVLALVYLNSDRLAIGQSFLTAEQFLLIRYKFMNLKQSHNDIESYESDKKEFDSYKKGVEDEQKVMMLEGVISVICMVVVVVFLIIGFF